MAARDRAGDARDFDNGCPRCFGIGLIRGVAGAWMRCPACVAHRRPADPELLPLIHGGQGRSGDEVRATATTWIWLAFWLLLTAGLIVFAQWLRGGVR